jgi:predicted solute-binding protein
MWMMRSGVLPADLADARDEGVAHIPEIVSNYQADIGLNADELTEYLSRNISYAVDDSMQAGMELYFKLASGSGLIERARPIAYLE